MKLTQPVVLRHSFAQVRATNPTVSRMKYVVSYPAEMSEHPGSTGGGIQARSYPKDPVAVG